MIYATPADVPLSTAPVSEVRSAIPRQLMSEQKPEVRRPIYTYRRRILPIDGGKLLLRLWDDPKVEVDPQTLMCEVVDWGLSIPHGEIHDIDRRMARRFLELFSKADAQLLTEAETATWVRMLDQIDYTSFCAERAAPHYVEGTLLRKQPVWRVEWHDGEKVNIPAGPASALRVLNDGDHFGAFIKLGRDNEVKAIERVVVLSAA
jgi:hypothetical protein